MNRICLLLMAAVTMCVTTCLAGEQFAVTATQNTPAILQYDIFELTFSHDNAYANPFFDAQV